jgi:hypothetical protein
MKHFIITRFRYPEGYRDFGARIQLLRRFAEPSVNAQACQEFEWLILCDRQISVPRATLTLDYRAYIAERTERESLVLTTRFDSDDVLAPSFVSDVQRLLVEPGLLDFSGYIVDLRIMQVYNETVYNAGHTSHFLTVAEDPKDARMAYFCKHTQMWRHFRTTRVEKRNWAYIIHGWNTTISSVPEPNAMEHWGEKNNRRKPAWILRGG